MKITNKEYKFLEDYIDQEGLVVIGEQNNFTSLELKEIEGAEKLLTFHFPDQLRKFYLEVGFGNLTTPCKAPKDYKLSAENEILSPSSIVDIMLNGHDSGLISQDVLDLIQPGDMPFFHIFDSCLFLVMRPKTDKPNAVYNQWGDLVEETFNKFIWRLYYEDPSFYENI